MKRDMDVIRALLLKLEARHRGIGGVSFDYADEEISIEGIDPATICGHLALLVEAGFVRGGVTASGGFVLDGITWPGHDFIDSVRDEEIWRRTKEGVNLAGGFTFDLMKGLAKGFLKKKVQDLTGIEVSL